MTVSSGWRPSARSPATTGCITGITGSSGAVRVSADTSASPTILCFLLKVASRCNLACDYCYMYEHADQSWRQQPHMFSAETSAAVISRIGEYVAGRQLPQVSVVFHGGEPLLFGAPRLADLAARLREAMPDDARCDVSLQTNGVLLTADALDILADADIGVSISLDGPRAIHDLHRLTPAGRSSHHEAERALALLAARPRAFAGVIAVIDPLTAPRDVLSYFAGHYMPALDLLLPDATYMRPPIGRDLDPDLYVRWLIEAFDVWFDEYPELPIRMFDSMLGAVCGQPSPTDAFGFGSVSLLTVETDGSYHDLDVLKITAEGRSALGMNVRDHSVEEACAAPALAQHGRLLSLSGLSETCRSCPEVFVCGGGAVPHRYADDGFDHPSVYCAELLALIQHIRARLIHALATARPNADARRAGVGVNLVAFEAAAEASAQVTRMMNAWKEQAHAGLAAAIRTYAESYPADESAACLPNAAGQLADIAVTPSAVLWTRLAEADAKGTPLRALDGRYLHAGTAGLASLAWLARHGNERRPHIHRDDELLRLPFGTPIEFLPFDKEITASARKAVSRALDLIGQYDGALLSELRMLCTDIQLVRDLSAHPDKTVSFSDDSVPGALYVAPVTGHGDLDVVDLADSIIHEHRHQKLYLLSRVVDLVAADRPLVHSPWREEPRPPSGVLHAVFVFAELKAFWDWIANTGQLQVRARDEVSTITSRLQEGVAILGDTALTPAGRRLVTVLASRAGIGH
jgi:uncharacterized protein